MTAAGGQTFTSALQDFQQLLTQPKRLLKVHPGIAAWIQVRHTGLGADLAGPGQAVVQAALSLVSPECRLLL